MKSHSVKLGRPPKDITASTTLPPIRVTPDEKRRFKEAAEREGLSLSAWLKLIANEKLNI